MEVNFKGFKNTGVQICDKYNLPGNFQYRVLKLNTQITDDFLGKDLKEFSQILKNYPNSIDKNFLNIDTYLYPIGKDMPPDSSYYINGKYVPINVENLKIFGKIARFIRKIAETPDYYFKVSNDYINGPDCEQSFIFQENSLTKRDLIPMHATENVKYVSQIMVNYMTQAIEKFLC